MPANSILCIDQSELSIDFSGQTIPIGSFITATQDANPDPLDNINYCFQIYLENTSLCPLPCL